MIKKNCITILLCLLTQFLFSQKKDDFILLIEDLVIVGKPETSTFIKCKLINNTKSEIKIPQSFIMNDYLYPLKIDFEIGAIVYKMGMKGKNVRRHIRKDVHVETNIQYTNILPTTEGFFSSELLASDLVEKGVYKMKLILEFHFAVGINKKQYKKIYSNWFFVTIK